MYSCHDKNDKYMFGRIMKFEAMVYIRIILSHLSSFAYNLVTLLYHLFQNLLVQEKELSNTKI